MIETVGVTDGVGVILCVGVTDTVDVGVIDCVGVILCVGVTV